MKKILLNLSLAVLSSTTLHAIEDDVIEGNQAEVKAVETLGVRIIKMKNVCQDIYKGDERLIKTMCQHLIEEGHWKQYIALQALQSILEARNEIEFEGISKILTNMEYFFEMLINARGSLDDRALASFGNMVNLLGCQNVDADELGLVSELFQKVLSRMNITTEELMLDLKSIECSLSMK